MGRKVVTEMNKTFHISLLAKNKDAGYILCNLYSPKNEAQIYGVGLKNGGNDEDHHCHPHLRRTDMALARYTQCPETLQQF